ncbi:MAG TPA: isochorismatase family protein [Ktedonobacterales bacterium]|nr:isochorismatase family protein [Ktedonobacterales bacterium]
MYENHTMTEHLLIDHHDCVMIVIDAQPAFLDKLPDGERRALVSHLCWLIGVATWLQIPLVATAEDLPHLGGVAPEIARILPDTSILNKMIFGLADDPAILDAVAGTNRGTAVLTGLETDVCVAQSALGLLERGYRVVAVADATGSPGPAHDAGLARMRDAGVVIVQAKNLYYEWLRTVEQVQRFRTERADLTPPEGLRL